MAYSLRRYLAPLDYIEVTYQATNNELFLRAITLITPQPAAADVDMLLSVYRPHQLLETKIYILSKESKRLRRPVTA